MTKTSYSSGLIIPIGLTLPITEGAGWVIIASVAAYETEVRAERVKAGQEAARAKGKRWGGSKRGVRKGKVASIRKHVFTLHENGVPKTQIAKSLNISIPTVYDVLKEGK
jgi:DNA invertase Pin-like site-specific DNA recombinase